MDEAMVDPKAFLLKLNKNLNILQEREAKYAGNPPLDLINQIADHQTAIGLTEQVITGAITAAAWREALKPLLIPDNLFQAPVHPISPLPTDAQERRNLAILLQKVKTFWIEGVLDKSIHTTALIELGKQVETEAVEHPWERVLELPDQTSQPLPVEEKISAIFERMNRAMLILGEPGSGKTITLLELARELIDQVEATGDFSQPLPVVFNLSSWSEGQPLLNWLVAELSTKYQIPRRIGRPWLGNHRLLPLLDGLDEVRANDRAACVEAINAFGQEHGLAGLVVCSRLVEYTALPARLKLNGAIRLQPLTPDQVDDYLTRMGPAVDTLRETLQQDEPLRELAQSPLMLNIMSLAYQDGIMQPGRPLETAQARRKRLFETYIERIFKRRGERKKPYADEQTINWLSWLARGMSQHNQSIFLIEQLQPSWLPTAKQRFWYGLIVRLTGGVIFILAGGLGFLLAIALNFMLGGDTPTAVGGQVVAGFITGGIFGLAFVLSSIIALRTTALVAIGLATGLTVGAASLVDPANSLLVGLLFGLPGGVAGVTIADPARINIDEMVYWSWPRALLVLGVGLVVGLGLEQLLQTADWANALAIGLLIGIGVMLVFGARRVPITEETITPDKQLRYLRFRAVRAGLTVILASILFGVPIGWLDNSLMKGVLFGLIIGVPISLATTLLFGGAAYIQHLLLRLVFWYQGESPLHLVHFLDYATECILLHKVGGGYSFIHRLLLEHFSQSSDED